MQVTVRYLHSSIPALSVDLQATGVESYVGKEKNHENGCFVFQKPSDHRVSIIESDLNKHK